MSILLDGIIFSLQRHGGISVYFKNLIKALVEEGVQHTVLLYSERLQSLSPTEHVSDVKFEASRVFERIRNCRLKVDPQVFHSSYYRLPEIKKVPSVVTVHDFVNEKYNMGPKKWVHSHLKFSAIRSAQHIICISETTKRDLLSYVEIRPWQELHVVYNGVSETFRPNLNDFSCGNFMLFVGQRSGYKNFKFLLNAMRFLPDIRLICVGGGAFSKNELGGVEDKTVNRIKHVGYVSDEELNELYNNAICLVYPSLYEGFGIPVVEAMRAGCPVISVDCSSVLEIGKDALIVTRSDDPKDLASSILAALSTDREYIIRRGMEIAGKYSWALTHRKTIDIYKKLANI